MPEKRDLDDHEHIDDGLKLAFGGGSVLDAIESTSGTRARILLRDATDDAALIHAEYRTARREFLAALRIVVAEDNPGTPERIEAECASLLDHLG